MKMKWFNSQGVVGVRNREDPPIKERPLSSQKGINKCLNCKKPLKECKGKCVFSKEEL